MRDSFQFCIVIVCLITTGCATGRFVQPPRDTITFDYVPTTEAAPGSADVTFAIVGAEFIAPTTYQQGLLQQQGILPSAPPPPLFQQLISNMTKDFEEALTARGYTIEGVYHTFDEMNYPNKEGSDLILTAKVKFTGDTNVRYNEEKWKFCLGCSFSNLGLLTLLYPATDMFGNYESAAPYVFSGGALTLAGIILWMRKGFVPTGRMQFVCEVALEIYEGLTGEIMWSKRIPIPPVVVIPKAIQKGNPGPSITWQQLMAIDNNFYSDLGLLFESQYGKILKQIYIYLDPREMAIVKNQAMELRKRKVY